MKKVILMLTGLALVSAGVQNASAGDREWATAGKVLTGVFAGSVLFRAMQPAPVYATTVVEPAPVYYAPTPAPIAPAPTVAPAPVVGQTQVTVVQPQVVQPQVVYVQPAPVYYAPAPTYYTPAPVVSIGFGIGRGYGYYDRGYYGRGYYGYGHGYRH